MFSSKNPRDSLDSSYSCSKKIHIRMANLCLSVSIRVQKNIEIRVIRDIRVQKHTHPHGKSVFIRAICGRIKYSSAWQICVHPCYLWENKKSSAWQNPCPSVSIRVPKIFVIFELFVFKNILIRMANPSVLSLGDYVISCEINHPCAHILHKKCHVLNTGSLNASAG